MVLIFILFFYFILFLYIFIYIFVISELHIIMCSHIIPVMVQVDIFDDQRPRMKLRVQLSDEVVLDGQEILQRKFQFDGDEF